MSEQFEESGVSGGSWWRDRHHIKTLHPWNTGQPGNTRSLLACLFIPAGTLNYWQAWVFVAVFGGSAQALGLYFLIHDRKLVERRMNIGPLAEQRPAQKFISALFMLGSVGSTGPYAYVRHPMYSGASLLLLAMPLALGSWWSALLLVPFFPVLVWRILDEENFLCRDLPGYAEYMQRGRYRLVPWVW
jgi:Phospholipid methyltransferase